MAYVEFEKVKKTYHMGEVSIEALKDATFEIERAKYALLSAHPVQEKPRF